MYIGHFLIFQYFFRYNRIQKRNLYVPNLTTVKNAIVSRPHIRDSRQCFYYFLCYVRFTIVSAGSVLRYSSGRIVSDYDTEESFKKFVFPDLCRLLVAAGVAPLGFSTISVERIYIHPCPVKIIQVESDIISVCYNKICQQLCHCSHCDITSLQRFKGSKLLYLAFPIPDQFN